MKQFLKSFYQWGFAIPEKLYPFAQEIEGKWVRGRRAHQKALQEGFDLLGHGRFGFKLTLYRGAWHVVGSIVFITLVTFIADRLLGSQTALYVLLGAAIIALCFQEFVVQAKQLNQSTRKAVFDVFTWVLPMAVYVAFLIS
jgi:VIT1/CCC1 family predicted Fe2+/Mn2+ transporter